jgi:hypothetical protein
LPSVGGAALMSVHVASQMFGGNRSAPRRLSRYPPSSAGRHVRYDG